MQEEKFKEIFQRHIGRIMGLLEVSNNEALKREIKKVLWDLSDDLKQSVTEESKDGRQ